MTVNAPAAQSIADTDTSGHLLGCAQELKEKQHLKLSVIVQFFVFFLTWQLLFVGLFFVCLFLIPFTSSDNITSHLFRDSCVLSSSQGSHVCWVVPLTSGQPRVNFTSCNRLYCACAISCQGKLAWGRGNWLHLETDNQTVWLSPILHQANNIPVGCILMMSCIKVQTEFMPFSWWAIPTISCLAWRSCCHWGTLSGQAIYMSHSLEVWT